ncbi:hypothetical protein H0X06_06350, partial [Candidatus Dependentiae bacterium]|nr:hypothetical protein [Candidatus Dependentiae bacterium]
LSPNGKTALTGSQDTTACLWDSETGNLLVKLQHTTEVTCVAFSHEGKTICTVVSYNKPRLWTMIPCDATKWFFKNASVMLAWLLVKATYEKRKKGSCNLREGSLEHHLFLQLPDCVQKYLKQWYSLASIPHTTML